MNTNNLERYKELRTEIILDVFDDMTQEHGVANPEVFDELIKKGVNFAAMLDLYKETLKNEGMLPLSVYTDDIKNIKVLYDRIGELIDGLVSTNNKEDDELYPPAH